MEFHLGHQRSIVVRLWLGFDELGAAAALVLYVQLGLFMAFFACFLEEMSPNFVCRNVVFYKY